jgi:hypothetical protein
VVEVLILLFAKESPYFKKKEYTPVMAPAEPISKLKPTSAASAVALIFTDAN